MKRCIIIPSKELPELFPDSNLEVFSDDTVLSEYVTAQWQLTGEYENILNLAVNTDVKDEIIIGIIYDVCSRLTDWLEKRHPSEQLRFEPVNWDCGDFDLAVTFRSRRLIEAARKYLERRNVSCADDTDDDILKKYLHEYLTENSDASGMLRIYITVKFRERVQQSDLVHKK